MAKKKYIDLETLLSGQFTFSTQSIKPNYPVQFEVHGLVVWNAFDVNPR